MCHCQMWGGDEETCGRVSAGSKTHAERREAPNIRFLRTLGIDPSYPYNYEPTYITALQNQYPEQYESASDYTDMLTEAGPSTVEFVLDPDAAAWVTEFNSAWIKKLQQVYPVGGDK